MIKKYGDIIVGAFYMVVAIVLFIASFQIKAFVNEVLGPEFMPRAMAVIIFVIASVMVMKGIKKWKSGVCDRYTPEQLSYVRLIATFLSMVIYIAALETVGFIPMTIVYIIAQIYLLTKKEFFSKAMLLKTVLIAVIASVTLYYVFYQFFGIFLPEGLWQ